MLLALLGSLALLNVRAHRPSDERTAADQLTYLRVALEDGAADRMQRLFPEGYVFTWSLYGLASAQVAAELAATDPNRSLHLDEARRAVVQLRTPVARSIFAADLEPRYGAFYASWSLFVLAEYLRAVGPAQAPRPLLDLFEEECASLADALDASPSPFLRSYRSSAWPADTAVGVAALGIHDAILEPTFSGTIARWVAAARRTMSGPVLGLSHGADAETGAPWGGVRGSSLALMSRVLVEADPEFAREQYDVLRRHFADSRLGFPGMREFPRGEDGQADVDSGPLMLGFSGPAIVVGAAAARAHGDHRVADALLGVVESLAVPTDLGAGRRYAGGLMPIGDAFIAWAASTPSGDVRRTWEDVLPVRWFLTLHVASALLACLIVARFVMLWRRSSVAHLQPKI